MASNGQVLKGVGLPNGLDFSHVQLVLVRGDLPNTCGHIRLYIGGAFGHYFHFDGPSPLDYPRYLAGDGEYRNYLVSSNKIELMRKNLTIPHPARAEKRLGELMDHSWGTLLISHHCASFAAEVLHAVGSYWTMPQHCPVLEMGTQALFDSIFGPIRNLIGTEENYQKSLLK